MRPRGIKSFSSRRRDGRNLQCFQWFYDCPLPSGAIAFFINNASPFLRPCTLLLNHARGTACISHV